MPISGIRVLFIGKSWDIDGYTLEVCDNTSSVMITIARSCPDVIVTSGLSPGLLNVADFEIRKKWIDVDPDADSDAVVGAIESCYRSNIWDENKMIPLVSVYTGTYNTGDVLIDTYYSLKSQTYANWEWVVVDDGSIDDTWDRLTSIASEDHRVKPIRIKHTGTIGHVKDVATRLSDGKYLIELDHDDMLTSDAIKEVCKTFEDDENTGMVYSNCASFFADGSPHSFDDDFWKDRYKKMLYNGKEYLECVSPNIYDRFGPDYTQQFGWFLTVGPNHLRSYRAQTLRDLGGYNKKLPVADDWDLYARFFLYSKCVHLDKMLYLYRFHDNYENTTFTKNKSIQDHLEIGRNHYNDEFYKFNDNRLNGDALKNGATLSVVVLDWNTRETTEKCLKCIRESDLDCEIILVCNGDEFSSSFVDKTINMDMNIGFSAGCNAGSLHANGEFIAFINSDTTSDNGLLGTLIRRLEQDHKIGAISPYSNKAKSPQGNYQVDSVPQHDIDVDMVTGICMVMRRDLFFDCGGFDNRFCNFEDDDLCKRIKEKGYKCILAANTFIDHLEHHSFIENNVDICDEMEKSRELLGKKWPKVKIIAITYNEMDSLPGFFEQYKSITNDFNILDSGSTDGTLEWAEGNGVKVEHREFDRFDVQRNKAIQNLAGDAEWIIMHDPDERLDEDTIDNLSGLLETDGDIYYSPLRAKNIDGSYTDWVPKPFLFRNKKEIKWVNPVHEKLVGSHKQIMVKNAIMTHHIDMHSADRRADMQNRYDELGGDAELSDEWPILNMGHRDDCRIKKVFLGPKVSVIIPTYDRVDLLKRAHKSVISQDYLPLEIIVVGDNCPTLPQSDIEHINLPNNHGAGGAIPRNYGIYVSSSKWIAYLDDDNMWRPNHVSSVMEKILETGSMFGASSMEIDGKSLICDIPEYGKIDTSEVIHHKDLIRRHGLWLNRDMGYYHDWELFSRWVDTGEKWTVTLEPTLIYNSETSGQKDFLKDLTK